jgi:membrane-associated phospholipid phosphatase
MSCSTAKAMWLWPGFRNPMTNATRTDLRSPWVWCPPLAAGATLGLLLVSGANRELFLLLNGLSRYTGDGLWAHVTLLGDGLIAMVALFPLIRRRPEAVWAMIPAALLVTACLQLLHAAIPSPRPPAVLPAEALHVIGPAHMQGSFPSGHTSTAWALAAVLCGAWARRPQARTGFLVLASLAGLSRCVVGVHWPADVLGGIMLGWTSGWAGVWIAGRTPRGASSVFVVIWGIALAGAALCQIFFYHTGYPGTAFAVKATGVLCLSAGLIEWLRSAERKGERLN